MQIKAIVFSGIALLLSLQFLIAQSAKNFHSSSFLTNDQHFHLEKAGFDVPNRLFIANLNNPESTNYRITEKFGERFEVTNSTWNNHTLENYTYNGNGGLSLRFQQTWFNGNWVSSSQTIYTFDPVTGYRTEGVFQNWNFNNSEWDNVSRFLYTSNVNGLDTIFVIQTWDNNDWENVSRNLITYDNMGRLQEIIAQNWENGTWVNFRLTQYVYNPSPPELAELIFFSWNGSNWENSARNVYTYNVNGDFEEVLAQIWFNQAWFNSTRFVYFYDMNNVLTETLFQQWDNVSSWNDFSRTLWYFDGMGNTHMTLNQVWVSNDWIDDQRFTNTWESATGIPEPTGNLITEFEIKNYPNPFNPRTKIVYQLPASQFVNIRVFDLLGKELALLVDDYKSAGTHEIFFDAANLPSGIYLYQIEAGGVKLGKKMILAR